MDLSRAVYSRDLLRNSSCVLERDELEAESVSFGA